MHPGEADPSWRSHAGGLVTRGPGTTPGGPSGKAGGPSGKRRWRGGSENRPRRLLLLVIAAWIFLLAGVAASIVGGMAWDRSQQVSNREITTDTADTASAAIGNAIRADLNFSAAVQGLVATTPGLTNRQLAAWFQATDVHERYPGTAGVAVVEPVASSQLPAFISAVQADPPGRLAVDPYSVFPPGTRARYCLIRFAVQYVASPLPAGMDLCSPSPATLDQITRSDRSSLIPFSALLQEVPKSVPKSYVGAVKRALGGLFLTIVPIYRGGVPPASPAGRRRASTGWVLGTFSTGTVLASALRDARGLKTSLQVRQGSRWLPVGSIGDVAGSTETRVLRVSGGPLFGESLRVVVTRSVTTSALGQGLLLGLGGSLVSLLLSGFFVFLAGSRRRAIRLVEERTAQLRHQALHDSLTDLPNRALLFDRAQQMLLRARRTPMAVGALYVDLDNFKDINDTFGHQAGDKLLQAVGKRLEAVLRANDTVGRLGGDEFLVLVEGESLDVGPEMVAERIQTVLAEPFVLDTPKPVTLTVHASIGAAVGMRADADELIRDADVALYAAKAAGKDRVVVFAPEMQTAVQDRLALEMDLRDAIENGELFVLYQPIFDLRSVTAKGAEALVRWRHPNRGILTPDEFIPMAEESGLIMPLGRFVLDEACRQAAAWRADGHDIDVAVNVSARQLENGRFPQDVQLALERHHFPARHLTLEITETTIMRDTDTTAKVLHRLKQLGVRIAIDDFGTGYSSLSYLRNFPIDALKIDRSFITRISQTAESGALIHTLIQLGKVLDIETLAEGIEEQAQLARLQKEQCDSGQGFLFARPLDPEALATFFPKASAEGTSGGAARTGGGAGRWGRVRPPHEDPVDATAPLVDAGEPVRDRPLSSR